MKGAPRAWASGAQHSAFGFPAWVASAARVWDGAPGSPHGGRALSPRGPRAFGVLAAVAPGRDCLSPSLMLPRRQPLYGGSRGLARRRSSPFAAPSGVRPRSTDRGVGPGRAGGLPPSPSDRPSPSHLPLFPVPFLNERGALGRGRVEEGPPHSNFLVSADLASAATAAVVAAGRDGWRGGGRTAGRGSGGRGGPPRPLPVAYSAARVRRGSALKEGGGGGRRDAGRGGAEGGSTSFY